MFKVGLSEWLIETHRCGVSKEGLSESGATAEKKIRCSWKNLRESRVTRLGWAGHNQAWVLGGSGFLEWFSKRIKSG